MGGYKDTTFCVSPACVGACGRGLTPAVLAAAEEWWGGKDAPIAVGSFCGPPATQDEVRAKFEAVRAGMKGV